MWLISAPLLGAMYYGKSLGFGFLDIAGIILWLIGLFFEGVGDLQMARFKANENNKAFLKNTKNAPGNNANNQRQMPMRKTGRGK